MRESSDLRRGGVVACAVIIGLTTLLLLAGCKKDQSTADDSIATYRERMLVEQQRESEELREADTTQPTTEEPRIQLAGSESQETERAALMTGPDVAEPPTPETVLAEIPDLSEAERVLQARLDRVKSLARGPVQGGRPPREVSQYERTVARAMEYYNEFRRPQQVELTLAECIHRALANNYSIRAESYTPAISQARLVEAEAAFDAAFYLDYAWSNTDQSVASQLAGTQSDTRRYEGGIRKLMPTGMQASVGLQHTRSETNLTYVDVNPSYETKFIASFTQPLLRGFGLDYNRAGIEIARTDLGVSQEQFLQQVRETLLDVEQAYWQLSQARRNAMVLLETVAQNWVTYQSVYDRREHDATPVEVNNSKSRWQSRRVDFIEAMRLVRDAEDQLKNLLNDPEFLLSDDIELIPSEVPFLAQVHVDQFEQVRTALDERSEIRQSRLAIEQARIQTSRAKNETLPQLDLSFNYEVQGLDVSADSSFDRMTMNRYRSYSVGVNFSYPIGNRAARAALHQARLQEQQAIVQAQRVLDAVAQEVNAAVRQLTVRYTQIPPQLDAVVAASDNLRAFQARAETVNPNYLETELSAIEQLANSRQRLVQVIVEYNLAVVQLERAKGTLLKYNNVAIGDEPLGF